MSAKEESILAVCRTYGGWNADTSEPDIEDPDMYAHMEAYWEKVNMNIRKEVEDMIAVLEEYGWTPPGEKE